MELTHIFAESYFWKNAFWMFVSLLITALAWVYTSEGIKRENERYKKALEDIDREHEARIAKIDQEAKEARAAIKKEHDKFMDKLNFSIQTNELPRDVVEGDFILTEIQEGRVREDVWFEVMFIDNDSTFRGRCVNEPILIDNMAQDDHVKLWLSDVKKIKDTANV